MVFTYVDNFHSLHNILNTSHPNLTSYETELNDNTSFLDIIISKQWDGTLQRTVQWKATWADQYLQFSSFAPMVYKRG